MFYLIPPAGNPIGINDIVRMLTKRFRVDGQFDELSSKIVKLFRSDYCFPVNSGRSALYLILDSIKRLKSDAPNIIIPAYTCYSVAAAIARCGLKIQLVDIDPVTLDYNYDKLNSLNLANTSAIVSCNLFGILSNWDNLHSLVEGKDIYLIDDAAQSMGSKLHETASGCLGDIGFYSFGRGKNISTYSGGVIVTSNKSLATNIAKMLENAPKPIFIDEALAFLKMLIYSVFLKPCFYWIPSSLPFLGIGKTVFDTNINPMPLSLIQKCAGTLLLDKLDTFNSMRKINAKNLIEAIIQTGDYVIPGFSRGNDHAYIRLPVLCKTKIERDNLLVRLNRNGISSSGMYPTTIRKIRGIEKHLLSSESYYPGAESVVDRLLTLPVHPMLKENDLAKIINIMTKR